MTELTETQAELCESNETDYSDLKALFVNCTLKRSPEVSNTQGLMDISEEIMRRNGVAVETIRAVDHDIATGVWPDMTEHGWPADEWPAIYAQGAGRRHPRHLHADLAGGEVSVCTQAIERLYGNSHRSTKPASTPTTAGSAAAWSPATRTASSTAR